MYPSFILFSLVKTLKVNLKPILHRNELRSEDSQVVFDSAYFKNIDGVEAAIERNSRLQDIDSRVKEEYLGIVTQFYKVFSMTTRKCY